MQNLYDTWFLNHEPLLSHFGALDHDSTHRRAKDKGFEAVILQLKKNPCLKNRVQRWLDQVFSWQGENKKHGTDHSFLIFVKFQWELRKGLQQAVNYLSKVCLEHGCVPPSFASKDHLPSSVSKRKRHPGRRDDAVTKAAGLPKKNHSHRKNGKMAKADAKTSIPPGPMIVDHPKNERECSPDIIPDDDCRMGQSSEPYTLVTLVEASPNEQCVGPMIIDSHSCPSNLEASSTYVYGIDFIPQLGETVLNYRSKPSDRVNPVLVDVPTGASNASNSSTVDSWCMVSDTDVHTTSDSAPTCYIEPYTNMAARLDSSTVKIESEHSRGPWAPLNTSVACFDGSLPLVSHSEQYPAVIKMENLVVGNWLWYDDLCNDPTEEEAEANYPTDFDESQQSLLIDRPKAPLLNFPPIWAQSRQEICESFGWFRSYQGGVYYTREIVKGYLLGGFSASRDRFEHGGRLIISHGGGKAACMLQQKGQTLKTAEDDQLAQDRSVRALLRTYKECRPIVLVIDERYALFPFDLSAKGVSYAILGFYTIAHAWAEYQPSQNEQGCVVRYKFAFRWCEGQGEPWWIQSDRAPIPTRPKPVTSSRRIPVKLTEQVLTHIKASFPLHLYLPCCRCGEKSPKVYVQGWACLVPKCPNFWTTMHHQRLPDCLDYDPRFLELTKPFVLIEALVNSLRPSMPILAPDDGVVTSYASTKGWHCHQCGRLSCRDKWEKYECPNCGYSVNVSGCIRSSVVLRKLHVPVPFQDHYYSKTSGVTFIGINHFRDERNFGDVSCQTFALPYQRGFIHHIKAVHSDLQSAADEIFREYQDQALAGVLPFRRWPLRSHKCRGSLLTNYFSQNSGVPYQYVGGTANTLAWDKAPDAVAHAKEMIESRVSMALDRPVQFNEVLSAAYMERQRMSFHSDSEPGLGPLVAGLSLGSPALMHFRLLAKYEPIGEQRQIAMSFVLRHGDVLVMDGAQVQEYYEHTVIPSNFRIAATARLINNNHPSSHIP